jgi:hypothetical protein
MAKPVLQEFVEGRPNDRIGLVVFAAQAFIATPLTLDHDYLLETSLTGSASARSIQTRPRLAMESPRR